MHLVDRHVNQRSLVVCMTRHTHRYGMNYSAKAVGSFESFVQFGERTGDKISLDDFAVRDPAEHPEAQKLVKLRAAIERERELWPNGKPSVRETPSWHLLSQHALRERGVRNISHDGIFKIMLEIRVAASDTQRLANGDHGQYCARKLAPKQSRGMRR